jgi:C-terminal processing protease CtpA/Prc
MNTFRSRITPLLFLIPGLYLVGCGSDPVSSPLDNSQPAYNVQSHGGNWRLDTRIPVAPSDLPTGVSTFTGKEYIPWENPPGEPVGKWTRQNSWYYPQKWTGNEEFWYGWMLLDVFSVDRGNHTSPILFQTHSASGLFDAFRNDRFTAYYPPEVAGALEEGLSGTGVDSVFGFFFRAWPRDTLVAAQVENGSAAWNAGIRADDRLLEFDGRWAATSIGYLHDTAGHRPVEIRYLRPITGECDTVTISRSLLVMPSVFFDTLPGAIGYIGIAQFVATSGLATDTLFQTAATWLDANSTGAWILDLRGNSGGTIATAQNILSAILPRKSDLLCFRQREFDPSTLEGIEQLDTLRTNDSVPQRLTNRPIYLLQDRYSASSSEIVISSLRENLGGSIHTLGDTSYGKGIGQLYIETPLRAYMAITCVHINPLHVPSYHGLGIAPDVYSANGDSTIDKAWKLARPVNAPPVLVKKSIADRFTPNLAAIEWNRHEMTKTAIPILRPRGPGRPFPLR